MYHCCVCAWRKLCLHHDLARLHHKSAAAVQGRGKSSDYHAAPISQGRFACAAGKIHWRNTLEQLKLVGPKSMGVALLTAGFVGMVFTIQVQCRSRPHPLARCAAPLCADNFWRWRIQKALHSSLSCGLCCPGQSYCPRHVTEFIGSSGRYVKLLTTNPAVIVQFVREFAKLGLTRSVGGVLGLALARELTPVVTSIILAGESQHSQYHFRLFHIQALSWALMTALPSERNPCT